MLRTCFVARLVGETAKSVDIFCRFEPSENGQSKLPELPSAQNLGTFCFPTGASNVKPREYGAPEEFTFTLTGGDGSKTHGFCRTFLPPRAKPTRLQQNANMRYPQVVCIISKHLWLPFFFKVLQVVEALLKQGDLLTETTPPQLPSSNPASLFLQDLLRKLGSNPAPGTVLRVDLPKVPQRLNVSPPRRMCTERNQARCSALQCTDKFIELQVPADCGNGLENAGVPLAKLLYYVKDKALITLIEALLLERRILMLAEDSDRVTSAVHAAAALLFPFRWQHIYLPLLPHALQDYLLAPMPFLVGVPAAGSFAGLRSTPLDEITVVNLDAGTCTPGPGLPPAEPSSLPWAEELAGALQAHTALLRSPTEWEISPRVSLLMQSYFLKLLSRYRDFMEPDADQAAVAPGHPGSSQHNHHSSADSLRLSRRSVGPVDDDAGYLRANGWRFHHAGLVASHRRNSTRAFLEAFRHSQMYEVFITQRLALAAEGYATGDTFEVEVEAASKRSKHVKQIVSVGAKGVSKGKALLQRAGHSVKTLRHSITGMEDLLSEKGINLPRLASAASLPRGSSQRKVSPLRARSAAAAELAAPIEELQDQKQLEQLPEASVLRPEASAPLPDKLAVEQGGGAMAGPATVSPLMSGAMAETTSFFTLDEDEESGSDDESAQRLGAAELAAETAARKAKQQAAWADLHLEFPLALADPALSPRGPPSLASPNSVSTPGTASFSLLDLDYGSPAFSPAAARSPTRHAPLYQRGSISEEAGEDTGRAPPAIDTRQSEGHSSVWDEDGAEGLADLGPVRGSENSFTSQRTAPDEAGSAPAHSLVEQHEHSTTMPLTPPVVATDVPSPPSSGRASGSVSSFLAGIPTPTPPASDPFSLINPFSNRAAAAQIPMAAVRSSSGPLPVAPPKGMEGLARESAPQRVSQDSELAHDNWTRLDLGRGGEDEADENATSSRTASVDVMNSSSFGLGARSRSGTLPSSEGRDRSPVRPASGASTPRRSPGPAAGTSSLSAFASRLPTSSDAMPVATSSPAQAPPAQQPTAATAALRGSLPRPSPALLDPLSSIDPFGRHAATALHSPQPSASPVADVTARGRAPAVAAVKGSRDAGALRVSGSTDGTGKAARALTWSDFGMGSLSSPLHIEGQGDAGVMSSSGSNGPPQLQSSMLARKLAAERGTAPLATACSAALPATSPLATPHHAPAHSDPFSFMSPLSAAGASLRGSTEQSATAVRQGSGEVQHPAIVGGQGKLPSGHPTNSSSLLDM